jgi:hypothetical protein
MRFLFLQFARMPMLHPLHRTMQARGLPCRHASGARCVVRRSAVPAAGTATGARSLEALRTFMGSKGTQVDKVAVSEDVATGLPMLVAAKDCAAGETLLSVGDALWMSPEAIKRHPIGKEEEVAALEPWLQACDGVGCMRALHDRVVCMRACVCLRCVCACALARPPV